MPFRAKAPKALWIGRLDAIADKISKGDYLLIQFGHNDQKIEDQTRYTIPNQPFKDYLKRYIEKAKLRSNTYPRYSD